MLWVHRSNRVERLVELLAAELRRPLVDPMATELVVVHSQGMQRWLSQRLSQRLGAPTGTSAGICANFEYPFPARLVRRVLADSLSDRPDAVDPWEPDRLVWTILDALPGLMGGAEFAAVARYLDHDEAPFEVESIGRRRFALARHIADLFDRYAVYRPWMARRWSHGDPAGPDRATALPSGFAWQPALWKAVQDRVEVGSPADRFERARQVLATRAEPLAGVPERLSLFGLGTLPPSYLGVLQSLSRLHDVHLYLLCPSREYWAEIRNRREILDQTKDSHDLDAELALEAHPILASFGRLARDFQLHLESAEGPHYVEVGEQPFEDPGAQPGARMLAVLQSDVLDLRAREGTVAGVGAPGPVPVRADDVSVQVHSCHGPTRQVEVLRDAILRLMENQDSTLQPRDVVVMTPDVEAYAPVIAAVFSEGRVNPRDGGPEADRWDDAGAPQLPFAIADRNLRETNPVASALLHLLEMVHGRVEASTVLDLLRMDVVRPRFDIAAEDMQEIEVWVRDSGIRWGIDRDHRKQHDQPEDHENTWRFGLDRLLLGVAMADEGSRSFGGTVPFDDMEGGAVERLGRFVEFCETSFALLRGLDRPRPLLDWMGALEQVLEHLIRPDETHGWQVQQVREVLATVLERARGPNGEPFAAPLELDAMRHLLAGGFGVGPGSIGHQTGSITVCAMVPMRSIPHRVVCLLGMDDAAFPRADHAPALDLMGVHRQIGDRSPREEDRFSFLEAILAARESLIITYTGYDIRTNEVLPPAVPVGQLLDVLDAGFRPASGFERVRDQVTVHHPLQAFSPRNFEPTRPLGYDRRMLEGARCLVGERRPPPLFLSGPLEGDPAGEEDAGTLDIRDLVRFWQAPVAWLVSRRLGIYLRKDDELVEDREPIELDHLERWRVGASLLGHELGGGGGDWATGMLGRGSLPSGAPGQCALQDADRRVRKILAASAGFRTQTAREVVIDAQLEGRRLVGTIDSVYGSHLIRLQFGRVKPKHRLTQWIQFLALHTHDPETDWDAMVIGNEDKRRRLSMLAVLGREAHARLQLQRLIDLYVEGQSTLLPFFGEASYAYGAAITRNWGDRRAYDAARKAWHSDWGEFGGEDEDPCHVQVWGARAPWTDVVSPRFVELATEVWSPILALERSER